MSRAITLILAACLALSGCGRRAPDYREIPDAHIPVSGGTRVDASAGEAGKLNPYLAGDTTSSSITDLVFNGLLRYNPKLELEGELAESWQVRDGGRTIIFKLKPGVKWHDGQPFTSADVKFTVESILDPKVASPRKSGFDLIERIETPDPLTVIARYKKPFAPALQAWGGGIAPKHLLEGKDVNEDPFNRNPVGTGPYKFVKWVDKQYIELAANPDYFEGPVRIAKLLLRHIPEPATQLLELRTGGIDGMTLQPEQFAKQTGGEAFERVAKKYRFPGMSQYTYLGFNHARQPFGDKRVRWALSHAIDRDELITGVAEGLAQPCSGPYSPLVPAYDPGVKPVAYDLAKAAALLDEAGWKPGPDGIRMKDGKRFEFKLITNKGNVPREKTVLILQQQFAKLGVKAEVQVIEWSTFLSNYVDKKDFDAVVMGWQLALDPDQYSIWHSSQTGDGQFNFISYKNPKVDALLEQGRAEFDPAKRTAIYRAFHRQLAEDQALCFLYAPDSLSALSRKFQGLMETETGYAWYWATRWYIPTSAQRI
jgi:peptide/nickel transport system substrate-binding protein